MRARFGVAALFEEVDQGFGNKRLELPPLFLDERAHFAQQFSRRLELRIFLASGPRANSVLRIYSPCILIHHEMSRNGGISIFLVA